MDDQTSQTESLGVQESQQKADNKFIKISFKKTVIIAVIAAIILVSGMLVYFNKGLLVAATVNGSLISRLDIVQKLEKESGKSLLDSLITEKLVQSEADAKKIIISNDEINAEIKKIEDQVVAQGGTLDAALAAQSMSMNDLRSRIVLQKEMEKLVADKINVTDQEVAQYITDNKVSIPEGQEAAINDQIKSELRNQKLDTEAQALITDLKSKAKIQYFVNY